MSARGARPHDKGLAKFAAAKLASELITLLLQLGLERRGHVLATRHCARLLAAPLCHLPRPARACPSRQRTYKRLMLVKPVTRLLLVPPSSRRPRRDQTCRPKLNCAASRATGGRWRRVRRTDCHHQPHNISLNKICPLGGAAALQPTRGPQCRRLLWDKCAHVLCICRWRRSSGRHVASRGRRHWFTKQAGANAPDVGGPICQPAPSCAAPARWRKSTRLLLQRLPSH